MRDSNKLIKDEQTKLEKNIKVEKRLDYNQLCKDCGEKFKALLTEGQLKKLELLKGKEFKELLGNKGDIKIADKTEVTMGNYEARIYVEK